MSMEGRRSGWSSGGSSDITAISGGGSGLVVVGGEGRPVGWGGGERESMFVGGHLDVETRK